MKRLSILLASLFIAPIVAMQPDEDQLRAYLQEQLDVQYAMQLMAQELDQEEHNQHNQQDSYSDSDYSDDSYSDEFDEQPAAHPFEQPPFENPRDRQGRHPAPAQPAPAHVHKPISAQDNCAICLEQLQGTSNIVCAVPCDHHFHKPCIEQWKNGERSQGENCPVCRVKIAQLKPMPADAPAKAPAGTKNAPKKIVAPKKIAEPKKTAAPKIAPTKAPKVPAKAPKNAQKAPAGPKKTAAPQKTAPKKLVPGGQQQLDAYRRRQAQIHADAELARRLQEEDSLALARQLQAEAEQDYAAFRQYSLDEARDRQLQTQLEQRRRELEERYRRESLEQARDRRPVPTPVAPQPIPGGRAIAPCVFGNDVLRLPGLTGGGIRIPGVYHVRSRAEVPERKDWSCGFHAVYNMVKLERRICNRQIENHAFVDACKRIAPRNLHGFSDLDQGLKIAKRLGIPYAYNLIHERGRSELILDDHHQREQQFWQNLRRTFNQARGPLCIHFDCHIESHSIQNPGEHEGHAVLITLVRMADGATAIYIFDNVNEDENHISQAQIRAHVELIHRNLLG